MGAWLDFGTSVGIVLMEGAKLGTTQWVGFSLGTKVCEGATLGRSEELGEIVGLDIGGSNQMQRRVPKKVSLQHSDSFVTLGQTGSKSPASLASEVQNPSEFHLQVVVVS